MRFCVVTMRAVIAVFVVVVAAVMLCVPINGKAAAAVFLGQNPRLVPIYEVATEEKRVAISFDAAWGADKTQGILDALKNHGASATFFLVGFWIEKFPDMVQKIWESGMEIGNHSQTHPDLTTLQIGAIEEEIVKVNESVEKITGQKCKVFRCPYGAYNNNVVRAIESQGMKAVQWDVDSLDWKGISAQEIAERILSRVKNGSIILCHNNADNILPALELVLVGLKSKGFAVGTVSDLIYQDNYIINNNGVQIKK